MKRSRSVLTIVGIVLGLIMTGKTAFADPGTLPPGQLPAFTAECGSGLFRYRNLEIPYSMQPGKTV